MSSPRTAGVVVLFHPPEAVLQNVESYLSDVEVLYLFDNSPGTAGGLVERMGKLGKTEYLTAGSNVGVPRALNVAAVQAMGRGCDFLLTMDQDSRAGQGMVPTMLATIGRDRTIGLVTPLHRNPKEETIMPEKESETVITAMTSGNLIRLSAYQQVGGFLEELFIDYVDYEYCLRLQDHGYSVVRANRAILFHELGRSEPKRFFGRTIHVTNHRPARFFYQTRNRRILRKRYRKKFPEFFKWESETQRGRLVKMLLYERDRIRKCVMMIRGMIAGWRNDFSSAPTL